MIDEIHITGLRDWPNEAIEELHEMLLDHPEGATVNTHMAGEIKLIIHDDWPKLKRERWKHDVIKTLDKAQVDHDLSADVKTVERVEVPDKEVEFDE